jgi:hypothetical protein
MHVLRGTDLLVRLASLAWATLLVAGGLWAIATRDRIAAIPAEVLPSIGIGLLGAAQFIYMVLFADRLFPKAHPLIVNAGELLSFLMFVAGLVLAAWYFARG